MKGTTVEPYNAASHGAGTFGFAGLCARWSDTPKQATMQLRTRRSGRTVRIVAVCDDHAARAARRTT